MSASGLPAFERIPAPQPGALIFLCDHASNALPPAYGTLGLPEAEFKRHIASDIGAAPLTRALAAEFAAPALLGVWSRLLIDLNRGPDDPTLVMKISDGALVPGNARIDEAGIAERILHCYAPYDAAIDVAVEALRDFMKSRPRPDLNAIYRYAQLDRVQSVIRPYLEAMT